MRLFFSIRTVNLRTGILWRNRRGDDRAVPDYGSGISAVYGGIEKRRFCAKRSGDVKLHFSQKTADLNWEEEIAYQLAEDTLIGIAVPME